MKAITTLLEKSRTRHASPEARAHSAYAHLKQRLLEGDLQPGDKLSVVTLAEELACSRVPVMEALKRLEGEGFVRIVPQVGCRIVSPSASEVIDFFALFAAVEGVVTSLAAVRRTASELQEFQQVCAHIDEAVKTAGTPQARDPSYRRLNQLFHTQIHAMAHSPVTTGVAAGLWDRSDFYIKMAFGSLYFSRVVRRAHQTIRDAIIDGRAETAEAAIKAHLRAVGERVAAQLAR